MMIIKTVPDLKLADGRLYVSIGENEWLQIHFRQGEIGRACAVYSLAFCLLYEGIVTDILKPENSNGGRLLKHLYRNYGIIADGFSFKKLYNVIMTYKTKNWNVQLCQAKGSLRDFVNEICDLIDRGIAPVVGVDYIGANDGHALWTMGYEEVDGKVTKLLCLDPGSNSPRVSVWNSFIDVSDLRKPLAYINSDPDCGTSNVRIGDYIVVYKEMENKW